MRSPLPLFLLCPLLLSSCAYEGVVVQKNSRPHPFYESLGVEEMNSFVLRDSTGATHSQMVTPEVYQRYGSGQYFNDSQPGPAQSQPADDKEMRTAMVPTVRAQHYANTPVAAPTRRVATNINSPGKKLATSSGLRKIAAHPSEASSKTRTAVIAKNSSVHKTAHKNAVAVTHAKKSIAATGVKKTKVAALHKRPASKSGEKKSLAHHAAKKKSLAKHSGKKSATKTASHRGTKMKSVLKPLSVPMRSETDVAGR